MLGLVRRNADFRRLWLGNIISLLGDWFNFIALINVIGEMTGSPFALGVIFIAKMLPAAIASPVAGLLVDRFDRRRLMIISDVVRAAIVAGLIYADQISSAGLVYLLTVCQVIVSAVFQPAQSAALPNVTTKEELLTANTLMAASWSVMLALGAALGGFATAAFGPRVVFAVDSASYLVSAWFIYRAVIPQTSAEGFGGGLLKTAAAEIVSGWKFLRSHGRIARISTAKATWALAGGALVYMLALAGEAIDPDSKDIAIGALFAARGVGTGIGPVLARRFFSDRRIWPALLGSCVAFSGAVYALFGLLPWSYALVLLVVVAHSASGANWVLATVMLQERTEDIFRGRVFATEWLLVMLADTVSILAASLLLETGAIGLRAAFGVFGCTMIGFGLVWLRIVVPLERHDLESAAET